MQFNDLGKQWGEIRSSVIEKIDNLEDELTYIENNI
jgi:hypothetical protein